MRQRALLFLFASTLAVAGCDAFREKIEQIPDKARDLHGTPADSYEVALGDPTGGPGGPSAPLTVGACTRCHGDPTRSNENADPLVASAPPKTLAGGDSGAAVGAHLAHLRDGPFRRAVECASCHLLPTTTDHPAQKMGKISFSRLSTTSWSATSAIDPAPAWNGTTCASTYCHGNFPNGAKATVAWSDAGVGCGSCHAVSPTKGPGGTHPTLSGGQTCGSCHGGSYTNTSVDLALHMNGRIDGGGHPAGWKEPDQHGLAALQPNPTGFADDCTACHAGFGPVAGNAGSACNLCHATPSDYGPYTTGDYPNHPDWQHECTFCHGGRDGDTAGAPPRNTHVVSSDTTTPQLTTDATIGAHRSHVNAAHGISLALPCTACHQTLWTSATQPGHIDETTADVFFNPVGSTSNPGSYARPTCSSTYCHGNFTGGAGNGPLSWTGSFGGSFTLTCTSCHGLPPGPTSSTVHHPPNGSCGSCHAFAAATHVDGTAQHTPDTGCTQCHGDLGASGVANTDVRAAPAGDASAVDAHGNAATATGQRGVGAHAKHLTGTSWRNAPIACGECHSVPAAGDVSHANGNPAVPLGGTLTNTAWSGEPAINPRWNGANGGSTLTCSSTYCHGAFKNGANAAPTWAAPSAVGCGSCHGVSATGGAGGTHPTFATTKNCGSCHGGTYTNTSVDKSLHMDGKLDVANLTCSTCHGDSTRNPVSSATALDALNANLVKDAPPGDAGGGAAATGAHQAHVNQGDTAAPGALSSALACTNCHVVPTSTSHSTGTANVTFAGIATTGGVTPSPYDFGNHRCASTYCHGNFTGGAGANAVLWTATGKLACSSCHGAPPQPGATVHHPPNGACGSCHASYGPATVQASTHVDGTVQHTPTTGCTQCHGDLSLSGVASTDVRAAPQGDASAVDAHGNTATSARGVGAHAKHLTGNAWRTDPIACNECHAVPGTGDVAHADGNPAIRFGSLASTVWSGGSPIIPTWNGAGGGSTLTCSSTYCHGAFKNGANAAPTWAPLSAIVCGSCHGNPLTQSGLPGGSHPSLGAAQTCGSCHGGTYTNTSVDKTLHMNGVLDGGGEPDNGGSSCGGCHSTIWNAMNGTVSKASTHALLKDVPNDDATAWTGATLSGVAAANRSCVNMCHGDHPHDLTSPTVATHENNVYVDSSTQIARAAATRTSSTRDSTDFDGALASGGLCVSCHDTPVATGRPVISKTTFAAAAHDYASNTVGANTYSWSYLLHDGGLFVRDCTKCHASRTEGTTPAVNATAVAAVHYSDDDPTLLAGTTNPAGAAAGFVCYNCHGSTAAPAAGAQGNRSGKDIQSQIAHATTAGQSGHPANSDSVHDSVAEYTSASFGNALGVAAGAGQRHASCLDCHDVHRAKPGAHAQGTNLAGPPLEGAWGAKLSTTPAFWTAPASGDFTKTTIAAGTDVEATLCFKCHSSFYGPLPRAPSWSPSTWAETDTAMEFNPNNVGNWATAGTANQWNFGESAGSFHPVLASAGANLGVTNNIKPPWTKTSLMTCSDCHESDTATDPNGPHGSAARFILKGPSTTWDGTLWSGGAMPATAFCANCHDASWTGSRFPLHSDGLHGLPCLNCHSAIVHGAPRPGFLNPIAGTNTTFLPAIPGYDNAAPYAQPPNALDRLYLVTYPSTQSTTWGRGNCGCGGTNHSM